jgi:excisionase family DNA binding protein
MLASVFATAGRPVVAEQKLGSWLTIAQVAGDYGCCRQTVRRMIHRGELPATRVGSQFRIREEDAQALLAIPATPRERRAKILGPETLRYLERLANEAPELDEDQKALIRQVFRGGAA